MQANQRPIIKCLLCLFFLKLSLISFGQKIVLRDGFVFEQFDFNMGGCYDIPLTSFFQDSRGFIWLGCNTGVSVFDGKNINLFKEFYGEENSLTGRSVTNILENALGQIIISTKDFGINIFNPKTEKFINVRDELLQNAVSKQIQSVIQKENGDYILTTLNDYLTFNMDTKGSISNLKTTNLELQNKEFISQVIDYKKRLLVMTNNRIFDITNNIATTLFEDNNLKACKIKKDQLWVLTENRLGRLDIDNLKMNWLDFVISNYNGIFKDFDISTHNIIYLGTTNGLVQLKTDPNFESLKSKLIGLTYNSTTPNFAKDNEWGISRVFLDKKDNLYCGIGGAAGIFRMDAEQEHYKHIDLPEPFKSEPRLYLFTFVEDDNGMYWIGGRGLFAYDTKTDTFHKFGNNSYDGIDGKITWRIVEDRNGKVWFGTSDGIAEFNKERNTFDFYGSGKGTESSSEFLTFDKNQNIWFVNQTGFGKFDKTTKEITFNPIGSSSSLAIDHNGILWSNIWRKELISYDISSGKPIELKRFTDAFAKFDIHMIYPDPLNRLWICTNNGIYIFDSKEEKIVKHLNIKNKLLVDDQIFRVVFDSKDNTWVNIFSFPAIYLNINTFEVLDRSQIWMKSPNINRQHYSAPYEVDNNGKVFTDGYGGFFVYHPDSLTIDPDPPKVVLTDLSINDKSKYLNFFGTSTLEISDLNYKENSIQLNLKTIDADDSYQTQYAYRLKGSSEKWQYIKELKPITYNTLQPSTYEFEIKTTNNGELWSDPITLVSLEILPPWWKTNYANLMYLLLVSGIIFTIYKIQLHRQLAVSESKKLKEVDDFKNRFFANITHEFRTPLTVILGLTDKIEKKTGTIIKRNANQLLKLVNELLEIGKIESNFSKLNVTTQDMVRFSKYCMEALESLAFEKGIQLKFQSNKDKILMSFDAEKMQLILNNLLSNAIKFTLQNGLIEININDLNKHVEIKVKDSGIGIPKENLEKIFDRYYSNENKAIKTDSIGLGLALTRELVKLMNGTIVAKNNDTGGACFTVNMPIEIIEDIHVEESDPVSVSDVEIKTEKDQNIVLIIEDNQDVLNYTTSILEDSYKIVTAANGKLGYEMAIELIPDLIISDVMMPVMDGFEACERLKTDFRTDHIPVVMLTAKADIRSKISGLQQGADAYLSKPFNRGELLAHMDNLIKIREKLKEKYSQSILDGDASKPKVSHKFLDNIKNILLEHLSDDTFGIHEICSEIGVSRAQFHRKLKALTGLSASIFIREIRLTKAYSMIKETALNISEIAYSVGFTDPGYFSKLFHEKYKLTPSQLKEKQY